MIKILFKILNDLHWVLLFCKKHAIIFVNKIISFQPHTSIFLTLYFSCVRRLAIVRGTIFARGANVKTLAFLLIKKLIFFLTFNFTNFSNSLATSLGCIINY